MHHAILLVPLVTAIFSANVFASSKLITGGPRIYKPQSTIHPRKMALPGVVVVKFKPSVVPSVQELYNVPELQKRIISEANPTTLKSVLSLLKVKINKASEVLDNIYLVQYSGTVTPAMMAQSLMDNADIEYVEPHYIYKVDDMGPAVTASADTLIAQQWALRKVNAFSAWNITKGSPSIVVGIVDTGVNWMHPDLYPNIWHNPNWQTDTQYPADSIGWDFGGLGDANGDPTPDNNPKEDFPPPDEHGTHVAGIVAAVGDPIGTSGVAPKCEIMAVKASQANMVDPSTGEPYIVYGFEGIIYAADHHAKIINCSWGGVGYSQYEQDVITYAESEGSLVVAAAGNDGSTEFDTPAYYKGVLSVAATDSNDVKTYYTNYSYNVSVCAPGGSNTGLDPGILSTIGTDQYTYLNGTSMASPCAAGVAALVASLHPNYTPEQILEQVRVSSDNIYGLPGNTGFFDQMGYGLVDAYRAVTVLSPGVQVASIALGSSIMPNNGGGISIAGDTIHVLGTVTDYLQSVSGLQLTLSSPNDPYVNIVNSSVSVGSLQGDGSGTYNLGPGSTFSFVVSSNAPVDYMATFLISITGSNGYTDYQTFSVYLNPDLGFLDVNNIVTTVFGRGNIGFGDYPNNTLGDGFVYKPDNSSLLFEGAFMAGTGPTKVVDVARDSTPTAAEEDSDFIPIGNVAVQPQGATADQEAELAFSDSGATSNRIGIEVNLHTLAYNRDSTQNFIIFEYDIHNLNSTTINNLFAGLFLDWDISSNGGSDFANFDRSYSMGYAYSSTGYPPTYAACALISGAPTNYTVIDNPDSINGIYNGFTKLHKWPALSGGTVDTSSGTTPTDISMVVSGGPVSIAAGSDTKLAFVLAAADGVQGLQNAVNVAREMYGLPAGITPRPSLPAFAELYQNYPNPFNPTTEIGYQLSSVSNVNLRVFDVLGREVATLVNQRQDPGYHNVTFDASKLASGVYFLRLTAVSDLQTYVQSRKMVVLK